VAGSDLAHVYGLVPNGRKGVNLVDGAFACLGRECSREGPSEIGSGRGVSSIEEVKVA